MTRILVDLPDEAIQWRDQLAAAQGRSHDVVLAVIVRCYGARREAEA